MLDSRLIKSIWRLFEAIAPEMTKFLLKSCLGIDSEELRSLMSDDESADLGARLVEEALKAHESTGNSVEEFRTAIKGWLDAVINTSQPALSYPLFVFVDELDRCRPTYAIEMLKTINHLFSIENGGCGRFPGPSGDNSCTHMRIVSVLSSFTSGMAKG